MRKILIVDDEIAMRKKYKRALVPEGFKILEAPNAVEVANYLMQEKSALDLILLDINIPQLDGRDIFDIINEYAPEIPIIVTSVHPLNDQKLKIPKATDYFNKADEDAVLVKKVKKAIGIPQQ